MKPCSRYFRWIEFFWKVYVFICSVIKPLKIVKTPVRTFFVLGGLKYNGLLAWKKILHLRNFSRLKSIILRFQEVFSPALSVSRFQKKTLVLKLFSLVLCIWVEIFHLKISKRGSYLRFVGKKLITWEETDFGGFSRNKLFSLIARFLKSWANMTVRK